MTDRFNPAGFGERVLLCVTGLSPQVVTETVFALVVLRKPSFVPTRIELLTTVEGSARAILTLLHPETGAYRRLLEEYELPQLASALVEEGITIMKGADGQPIADIQTEEDNAAAADAIVSRVRQITADPDAALHVSIAGGRKTMGFLAGHALSLFGRPQDRLSHILVADGLVTHPEFFYPPRRPRVLFEQHTSRPISTANSRLSLTDIPFLRLRDRLPDELLREDVSYTETIARAQEVLSPKLEIDLEAKVARFGGRPAHLPPAELAWLFWFAWRKVRGGLPQDGAMTWRDAEAAWGEIELVSEALGRREHLSRIGGARTIDTEALAKQFNERTSKTNRILRDRLGLAAAPYELSRAGKRLEVRTGLSLSASSITLHGAPTPPRTAASLEITD